MPLAAGPLRKKRKQTDSGLQWFVLSLVGFLLVWEFIPHLGLVSPRLFPPLSVVETRMLHDFETGELLWHLRSSAAEFGIGYLVAAALGVPLRLLLGAVGWLDAAISPYILSLYAMPSQAGSHF